MTQKERYKTSQPQSLNNDDLIQKLEKIAEKQDFHVYKKGIILFKERAENRGIYYIKNGAVKVLLHKKPYPVTLRYAYNGDVIGMYSVLNSARGYCSAQVIKKSKIGFIDKNKLNKQLKYDEQFNRLLIQYISHKIKLSENKLTALHFNSTAQRVASHFMDLLNSDRFDSTINYKIEELSENIGTTPNYMYKVLLRLNKADIINKDSNNRLKVIDSKKLRRLSEGLIKI